jgi:YVTN family beta-propeller protein
MLKNACPALALNVRSEITNLVPLPTYTKYTFVKAAFGSLQQSDTTLVYLNLIRHQLTKQESATSPTQNLNGSGGILSNSIRLAANNTDRNPTATSINATMTGGTTHTIFRTYENSTYGIKMQYPSDWIYSGNNRSNSSVQTVATFGSVKSLLNDTDQFPVILTVTVQSLHSMNMQLNTLTRLNLENLQSKPGFNLVESSADTLGGDLAHKLVFTSAGGDETMAVFTITGGKAYIIQYTTSSAKYSIYLPVAQKMINSFEIISTNKVTAPQASTGQMRPQYFLTYQNSTYGISIHYPSDWKKTQTDYRIEFTPQSRGPLDETPASLVVEIKKDLAVDNIKTLDDFASAEVEYRKRTEPTINVIEAVGTTLNGSPSYQIVFTYVKGISEMKDTEILTMKNGIGYLLEFIVESPKYSYYLPTVQNMVNSFEIHNSNLTPAGLTLDNSPIFIAVNPTTNRIYVTNSASNIVSVVDGLTNTIEANVTLGSYPYGIAVNPETNLIYVATPRSNMTYVIDGATNHIVDTLTIPKEFFPYFISVNPNINRFYVVGTNGVLDSFDSNTDELSGGGQRKWLFQQSGRQPLC